MDPMELQVFSFGYFCGTDKMTEKPVDAKNRKKTENCLNCDTVCHSDMFAPFAPFAPFALFV